MLKKYDIITSKCSTKNSSCADWHEMFPKYFVITLFTSHCNYDISMFYSQVDCELVRCRTVSHLSLCPLGPSMVPDPIIGT